MDASMAQYRPIRYYCVACLAKYPSKEIYHAPCGDTYCHACVTQLFRNALGNVLNGPPRCCGEELPLLSASGILGLDLSQRVQVKLLEFHTVDKTYCANISCSEFIKPYDIWMNKAVCSTCYEETCALCKGRAHWEDCHHMPRVQNEVAVLKLAKEEGWCRCYSCRSMIERIDGCYHISCKCGAEFCYLCGLMWKTCECHQYPGEEVLDDEHDELANDIDGNIAQAVLDGAVDEDILRAMRAVAGRAPVGNRAAPVHDHGPHGIDWDDHRIEAPQFRDPPAWRVADNLPVWRIADDTRFLPELPDSPPPPPPPAAVQQAPAPLVPAPAIPVVDHAAHLQVLDPSAIDWELAYAPDDTVPDWDNTDHSWDFDNFDDWDNVPAPPECQHDGDFDFLRSPHRCTVCHHNLPTFHFQCRDCENFAVCRRCAEQPERRARYVGYGAMPARERAIEDAMQRQGERQTVERGGRRASEHGGRRF